MTVFGIAEDPTDETDVDCEVALIAARFGGGSGDIDGLLEEGDRAREERDWATSDAIRDDLATFGIVVEDTADGSRWHWG